jgi:hypothetical protein
VYNEITSFQTDNKLSGQGNSATKKVYQYSDQNVEKNVAYWYELVDVDFSGSKTYHGPVMGKVVYIGGNLMQVDYGEIPKHYMLYDNFPNPFNMTTSINIDIPDTQSRDELIVISIFNVLGKKIKDLYRGPLSSGRYRMQWDGKNEAGTDMASGLYILSFQSQTYYSSKKMILLR